MHRWFYADENEICEPSPPPSSKTTSEISSPSSVYSDVNYTFTCLVYDDLKGNEKLAVVGNCDALGNWILLNCVTMTQQEGTTEWHLNLDLPAKMTIEYRYLICAIDPTTDQLIVRRWETHLKPRVVSSKVPGKSYCQDVFGIASGGDKVDRGWLTSETLVQLKFFNDPFTWKQSIKKRRLLFVKVTPMNLKIPNGCENNPLLGVSSSVSCIDDSLSNDTRDNGADLNTAFAFNEVASLRADDCVIRQQTQFGTECGPNDLLIFHLTLGDFDNTVYLIDLYTYSSKAALDEPPYHLGYHYIMPNLLKRSEGSIEVPITCASKHRPIGMMTVGYLIIRATPALDLNMQVSYTRYWNSKWKGLDIGHRGSGTSYKERNSIIRENTITSLKNAAEHGADMVEFDVQLSKDLVPVVYHDFMVYVLLKAKNSLQEHDYLALPLRDLTLEQLQNLHVYHSAEKKARETFCFDNDDHLEHQPFPQLADVLDAIDPHVGFNIEIKWSQKLKNGTMEEDFEQIIDRNVYIDCILEVVFQKAGERRIVFSCFDPDVCTMLRFKQNRYPVMFLTLGVTTKYQMYFDPRCHSISVGVCYAVAMELLGLVAHTEDLLRDCTQINLTRDRGLVLFCWGEDNNNKDTINMLKELGLHGIIYDKMDLHTTKEVKQSVFLVQARKSQMELLKLQALEVGKIWNPPAINEA